MCCCLRFLLPQAAQDDSWQSELEAWKDKEKTWRAVEQTYIHTQHALAQEQCF